MFVFYCWCIVNEYWPIAFSFKFYYLCVLKRINNIKFCLFLCIMSIDKLMEDNLPFRGTVTKKSGVINYRGWRDYLLRAIDNKDWLTYNLKFIDLFDSFYEGTSDVEVKSGIYVPVGSGQSAIASQVIYPDNLDSDKTLLDLKDVDINEVHEALIKLMSKKLFYKIETISLDISPSHDSEKSIYPTRGTSVFTWNNPKHIFFYATGSDELLKVLHDLFIKPESIMERLNYKLVDGTDYYFSAQRGEVQFLPERIEGFVCNGLNDLRSLFS